jgi:hypothetical protein
VEPQENDGKAERENSLALFSTLFSKKITTPNSENRGLVRIGYLVDIQIFVVTFFPFLGVPYIE